MKQLFSYCLLFSCHLLGFVFAAVVGWFYHYQLVGVFIAALLSISWSFIINQTDYIKTVYSLTPLSLKALLVFSVPDLVLYLIVVIYLTIIKLILSCLVHGLFGNTTILAYIIVRILLVLSLLLIPFVANLRDIFMSSLYKSYPSINATNTKSPILPLGEILARLANFYDKNKSPCPFAKLLSALTLVSHMPYIFFGFCVLSIYSDYGLSLFVFLGINMVLSFVSTLPIVCLNAMGQAA